MAYKLHYSDYAPGVVPSPEVWAGPPEPPVAITVPYVSTSPVHVPRRDLVLGSADSLWLRVTVVEGDWSTAAPITLTGGIGGPGLQMLVWPDTCYRHSWDYGAWWHGAWPQSQDSLLWSGLATAIPGVGAFDFSLPSGTMMSWPRRCGWCVQLNYSDQGAEVLLAGTLHIRRQGMPFQVSTGGLLTDDYIPVHTDIDQQVFT